MFGKLFLMTTVLALVEFFPNMVMATQFGNETITPEERMHVQFSGLQLSVQVGCLILLLLVQAVTLSRLDHLATSATADYRSEIRRGLNAFVNLFCAFLLSILIAIAAMALSAAVGALLGLLGALLLGKTAFVVLLVSVMVFMLMYVFLYLLFVQYSIVLDRSGPIQAINRSFNLVYGYWWHTVAVLLLMVLCVVIAAVIVGITLSPVMLVVGALDTGRGLFVMSVIQMIGGAFFGPFLLAVIYMLYRDLKLRQQGD